MADADGSKEIDEGEFYQFMRRATASATVVDDGEPVEGVDNLKGRAKIIGTLRGNAESSEFWQAAIATSLGPDYAPVELALLGEMRLSVWAQRGVAGGKGCMREV